MNEIRDCPYIQLNVDEADRNTKEFWDKYQSKPKTIIETSSVEAVRSLVAGNHGVTILSGLLFRPWSLDGGQIHSIPVAELIPSMNVGLVWKKKAKLSKEANLFVDFFRNEI